MVLINFATFILRYCKVIEIPRSYIPKIQAASVLSSLLINTPCGLDSLILFYHSIYLKERSMVLSQTFNGICVKIVKQYVCAKFMGFKV